MFTKHHYLLCKLVALDWDTDLLHSCFTVITRSLKQLATELKYCADFAGD